MKEIRDILRFWQSNEGQPLALATLVEATGSSYRRPGARMMMNAAGESVGGLSAGCIEEEVIACGRKVLGSGISQLMTFDTRRRFGCHGVIRIFVERVANAVISDLRDAVQQRQCCRLATVFDGDRRGTRVIGFADEPHAFIQVIEPVLRLILIGDGSDIAALRAQATLLGWEVLHLDGTSVPPEMHDVRTAVVVATHNYGRDCAALRDLLPRDLPYLGVIGSRRRRDDLLFDVMDHGIASRAELFAPAGLHLGADSPEEIALSIVAEIQTVFANGTAEQLRHRQQPIHPIALPVIPCAESAA